MICGAGDASCCNGGVQLSVRRRLDVLEASLGELLERFESLVSQLTEEDEVEDESEFEEEPDLKLTRFDSDLKIN